MSIVPGDIPGSGLPAGLSYFPGSVSLNATAFIMHCCRHTAFACLSCKKALAPKLTERACRDCHSASGTGIICMVTVLQ